MRLIIFFLLISSFIQTKSQETTVEYFKNRQLTKVVKESKAIYSRETSYDSYGIKTIVVKNYRKNFILKMTRYKGDKPFGEWSWYDKNGHLLNKIDLSKIYYFHDTELYCGDAESEDSIGVVFPQLSTTDSSVLNYLIGEMQYPEYAREESIQGTVYLGFKVSKEGKVFEVAILKGVHPILDFEAMRVISKMPDWSIGTKDGIPADFCFNIPIKFKLL